jgi:hypothetical protein
MAKIRNTRLTVWMTAVVEARGWEAKNDSKQSIKASVLIKKQVKKDKMSFSPKDGGMMEKKEGQTIAIFNMVRLSPPVESPFRAFPPLHLTSVSHIAKYGRPSLQQISVHWRAATSLLYLAVSDYTRQSGHLARSPQRSNSHANSNYPWPCQNQWSHHDNIELLCIVRSTPCGYI